MYIDNGVHSVSQRPENCIGLVLCWWVKDQLLTQYKRECDILFAWHSQ